MDYRYLGKSGLSISALSYGAWVTFGRQMQKSDAAACMHAAYDAVCETTTNSRFADPMRRDCDDLTEVVVNSGHWMAQEQPVAVNIALAKWLAAKLPNYWNS